MPAERLAAHVLRVEGFKSIDPSHPLGGPDGLKDVVCERHGRKWIGAAYFPTGKLTFKRISTKFKDDLKGVALNNADGIAFVTNQALTLSERKELENSVDETVEVEIFHLDRIASILDQPSCYGTRLEFLDIEMTREEQLSFMADVYQQVDALKLEREVMLALISQSELLTAQLQAALEKPSKTKPNSSPNIVEAVLLSEISSRFTQFGSSTALHKCSNCSFSFLFKYSPMELIIQSLSSSPPLLGVECPQCGNADKIKN